MKGFEKSTTDGRLTVMVDLRDRGLAVDDVEVDIISTEEYGDPIRITTTRRNLIELHQITAEALNYIGYPLKGFTNE